MVYLDMLLYSAGGVIGSMYASMMGVYGMLGIGLVGFGGRDGLMQRGEKWDGTEAVPP